MMAPARPQPPSSTGARRWPAADGSGQADQAAGPQSYAPQLAESWESSEDGLSLYFRLRDARWSDGIPVTAADVRFTWTAQTSMFQPLWS